MLPRVPVLLGAAGICGLAIGSLGMFVYNRIDKLGNQASFVSRALKITKEQPVMKQLVGEKLEFYKATFRDGFGKVDNTSIQLKLPVVGDNDKAFLYAYARRKDEKGWYRLFKLEAEFSKIKGKKLILLDRSGEDVDSDDEWEEAQCKLDREREKANRPKSAKELAEEERQQFKSMTPEERKKYNHWKIKQLEPKPDTFDLSVLTKKGN